MISWFVTPVQFYVFLVHTTIVDTMLKSVNYMGLYGINDYMGLMAKAHDMKLMTLLVKNPSRVLADSSYRKFEYDEIRES